MAEEDEGATTGAGAGHGHPLDPASTDPLPPEPKPHESAPPELVAHEPAAHEPAPPEPTADDPTPPEPLTVASAPAAAPESEWTASDARGPLMEADAVRSQTESMQAPEAHDEPASPTAAVERDVPPRAAPHVGSSDPLMVAAAPRLSAWPIAASLVAGALVGAVVAIVVYRTQVGGPDASSQVAALSDKVAALEAKPGADGSLETMKASLTDLQSQLSALQGKVASLPKTSPGGAGQAFDPGPFEQKIAALSAAVDAVQKQSAGSTDAATKISDLDGKVGALASAVTGLQKQVETNASGLQAVQSTQKGLEGKLSAPALAVVADSLVQQIDDGRPFAAQLDALASLGADPAKLAVLKPNATTGVASAKVLAAKFAPLTEPILATGHKAPPGASFLTRLETGLTSLIRIRRADDTSGTDLSSGVARIQADLDHDDLGDAVTTWTALPADAKAKSEAWGALAKTSADTLAAAHDLQSDAITAMGGRKS